MSRIGKKPIEIPNDVEVKIDGQKVIVRGPKGELFREIRPEIKVEVRPVKSAKGGAAKPQFNRVKGNQIFVLPQMETKQTKAFWGLTRTLLANMIKGVKEGYEKKLEIEGVGYKASVEENDTIQLLVGFTQPVKIKAPKDIKFLVEKNVITVSGIDKELVGQIAAKIRKVRPPEPYKGKGIRYQGEIVRRKVGKKVVSATG